MYRVEFNRHSFSPRVPAHWMPALEAPLCATANEARRAIRRIRAAWLHLAGEPSGVQYRIVRAKA